MAIDKLNKGILKIIKLFEESWASTAHVKEAHRFIYTNKNIEN